MSESGGNRKRIGQGDDVATTTTTTTTTSSKKKQKKGGRSGAHPAVYEPPGVVISRLAEDCAPQLSLSKDQLTVTGNKGFRMARASHGVSNGTWYWECTVLSPETQEGHCRLGWAMRTGSLQAPVGYDKSSYAYRDIAGSKVHESLRTDNYGAAWGPGDVIGFLIKIKQDEAKDGSALERASDSGRLGVEAAAAALSATNASNGRGLGNAANEIRFFKNGEDQGVAFAGIAQGMYYPAVSLYMGGSIRVNFGPEFVYPPPSSFRVKPISSMKAVTKEETKAQRSRIKQERATRGLEPARVKSTGAGATPTSGTGTKFERNPGGIQSQSTRSRSKSPIPRPADTPDIDPETPIGGEKRRDGGDASTTFLGVDAPDRLAGDENEENRRIRTGEGGDATKASPQNSADTGTPRHDSDEGSKTNHEGNKTNHGRDDAADTNNDGKIDRHESGAPDTVAGSEGVDASSASMEVDDGDRPADG